MTLVYTLTGEPEMAFKPSPNTHSQSTDDDFYKAKSEEYLQQAELHHEQDEAARNAEEGWPYSDDEIGNEG